MPWPLAPEIAAIGVPVLLALLCFGVAYLIRAIAAALPKVSLLFFSIDFGSIFRHIADPVANWLVRVASTLFAPVEHWLRGIGYSLVQMMFGTVHVAVTHGTQISHLHNVTIPAEGAAAVRTAHGYTAEQVQGVRDQIHAAQATWENAHSYADAVRYIDLQRTAPSVAHAFLAGQARTLIATENHAQDLHDQLKIYVNGHIAGVSGGADAVYDGQTLTGVAGAITIPTYLPGPAIPVEAIRDGTIATVGVAVAVIAAKITECLVSNCAGNNNFTNLLKDALGVAGIAELAVFLDAAINHPKATEATYADYFATVAQGAISGGQDVVSELEQLFSI